MKLSTKTIAKSLSPSLKAFRPAKDDVDRFVSDLLKYFERIDSSESEENLKTHLMDLFKSSYSPAHLVEQQARIDFVIRTGGKNTSAAILFEAKRQANKSDMIRKDDPNRKALHELVLYYMRERKAGNTDIQHLIICTEYEIYIFEASVFERNFNRNTEFRKSFEAWDTGKKSESTTDFFYREVAAPFIAESDNGLEATHLDLRDYQSKLDEGVANKELLKLFKLLSPHHLLNKELGNDSNSLNRAFYDELLHFIGLEERKEGGKRVIGRLKKGSQNPGSLLENTIGQIRYEEDFNSPEMMLGYGSSNEEREFNIALELCLTWVNRLLFLKLLEAQIFKFHGQDDSYKFLSTKMISDFDDLSDLFFKVLAFNPAERPPHIQEKYAKIPYLNSSLFELTRLEKSFRISSLTNGLELPLFKKTVLKGETGRRLDGDKNTLSYILDFLDAYDFGAVGGGDVQEVSKTIINAAVLGLIFEKINGYREGAIFTPGHVTMFMARKVIEKTVLEAFQRENSGWVLNEIDDLWNNITDRSKASILKLNKVIDNLKICDPAVGSGHFLVSCLNELICLKSRLGILADAEGTRLSDYVVEVDNDELIVVHAETDEVFAYQVKGDTVPKGLQHVQQTLFHEKQKLIESCLFGVDINSNSVQICQLRLWIELLKNAYYCDGKDGQLETLPNIDINIKCGNSLLSRFKLDQNLSDAFNKAGLTVGQYRQLVNDYKNTKDKAVKRDLQDKISAAKTRFHKESLGRVTVDLDKKINKLKLEEDQIELFVLGDEQQKQQDEKLAQIRKKIADLESRREQLLQNKTFLAALEWRFEFPEVLDEKGKFVGFDIIIANPPYMRVQDIEATQPDQKEFYERDYRTAHGSYDLANLFFELAVKLSKDEGNNNIFIFPHKLFNSANGAPLREYLMNTHAMKHITHFGANQVFDSAMTYTCIALFNTEPTETFRFKRFALGEDFEEELGNEPLYADLRYNDIASASGFYGKNKWIFFDEPEGYKVFSKCFDQTSTVGKKFEDVFQGIATSKDPLYIGHVLEEDEGRYRMLVNPERKVNDPIIETKEFWVEKAFFRPFLKGKDVHRYDPIETDRIVFFPYIVEDNGRLVSSDELKDDYPLTWEYVNYYAKVFKARERGRAGSLSEWYAYIYPKNQTKFDQEKLVSMEICSKFPNITLDNNSTYHTTKVYSLVLNDWVQESYAFFTGVLNSRLFWWFLKHTGDTLQGDARTMKTDYITPFPLPETVSKEDEEGISSLVTALVTEKAGPARIEEIQRLEYEINAAVYHLYGINDEDIEVIESAL